MSVAIAGKLTVIERNGRNGAFTVGELATEIGTFQLKHRVLDQFPEGSYDGVFYITQIESRSNYAKNRIWVSLYAELDWDALQIMAQNHQVEDVPESLKISAMAEEEATVPPPNLAQTHLPTPVPQTSPSNPSEPTDDTDNGLIDSLEKLQVQLDDAAPQLRIDASLEDRNLFRELRERIKQNGYRFHAQTQAWVKP